MGGGEIVTLQFGNYANHVGAHFWNQQEARFQYAASSESDQGERDNLPEHQLLFRAGETRQGVPTYTPRALIFDLRGGINALKEEGTLYDEHEAPLHAAQHPALWEVERVDVIEQPREMASEYMLHLASVEKKQQQMQMRGQAQPVQPEDDDGHERFDMLGSRTTHWNDYLRCYLHPRSLKVVNTYSQDDPSVVFDAFWKGSELMKESNGPISCNGSSLFDAFEDSLRLYMEECDSAQGFQIFTDSDNAFAGVTSGAVEYLREEYGRKGILVFGVHAPGMDMGYDPYYDLQVHQLASDPKLREALIEKRLNDHRQNRTRSAAYLMNVCRSASAVYVPLSTHTGIAAKTPVVLPFQCNVASKYEYSAVLASSIDTATLPMRMPGSDFTFAHLISALHSPLHIAGVSSVLPFPFPPSSKDQEGYLSDVFGQLESRDHDSLVTCLTPDMETKHMADFRAYSLRYKEGTLVPPASVIQERQKYSKYDKCGGPNEMLQTYAASTRLSARFWARTTAVPLAVGTPFPPFFNASGLPGSRVEVSQMAVLETGRNVYNTARTIASSFLTMRHALVLNELWDADHLAELHEGLQTVVDMAEEAEGAEFDDDAGEDSS